jgi:hypothetical protein
MTIEMIPIQGPNGCREALCAHVGRWGWRAGGEQ